MAFDFNTIDSNSTTSIIDPQEIEEIWMQKTFIPAITNYIDHTILEDDVIIRYFKNENRYIVDIPILNHYVSPKFVLNYYEACIQYKDILVKSNIKIHFQHQLKERISQITISGSSPFCVFDFTSHTIHLNIENILSYIHVQRAVNNYNILFRNTCALYYWHFDNSKEELYYLLKELCKIYEPTNTPLFYYSLIRLLNEKFNSNTLAHIIQNNSIVHEYHAYEILSYINE